MLSFSSRRQSSLRYHTGDDAPHLYLKLSNDPQVNKVKVDSRESVYHKVVPVRIELTPPRY